MELPDSQPTFSHLLFKPHVVLGRIMMDQYIFATVDPQEYKRRAEIMEAVLTQNAGVRHNER